MTNFATRKIEKEALTAGLAHEIFQRLPKHIVPDNYLICLKPNWKNLSFEGSEIVHLTVLHESKEVILNAADLTVGKIMWEEDVTENRQEPLEYAVDTEKELLKIVFEPPLNPSKGTLRINFSGIIHAKGIKGLYKPKGFIEHDHHEVRPEIPPEQIEQHNDHHHERHHETFTIATSFESTNARRCFPCWDEPGIKATFDICLIVPRVYTTISNMPIKVTYPHRTKKGLHTVEFRRTPVTSTYLICFSIGKFDFVWGMTADNVLCHVYTDANKKNQGKLALDFLLKILPYLNVYFELPYDLPKLDVVALPEHSPTAMENWGLIAFHEAYLMVNKASSNLFIQRMQILVAHEVAHQWFGNLVTMEWYSYLWLNEGFATFMSYLIVDNFYPQYEVWTQFVSDNYFKALDADTNRFSHPVESNVNNPSDIPELYDSISYYKGASLIRMLYHFLGPTDFQSGVNLYLSRHKYKTTNSRDLWRALQEASEKPVEPVMSKWVTLPGYPLVKVTSKQEGNYRIFTLTQEKFHSDPASRERDKHKEMKDPPWIIPITFASASKPDLAQVIMEKKAMTVSILIGKTQWVSVNPGQQGFFRVRYCPECFTQFLSAVRQKTLPTMERMGLIGDLFAMTQNGLSSTVEILSVLEAFIDETHYSVWNLISSIITRFQILLEATDFYNKYLSYVGYILSRVEEKTQWEPKENEGHLAALRRTVILASLVQINKDTTVQEAQKRFELFIRGEMDILPDLKIPVFKAILRSADEETIRTFIKMYREAPSSEERHRISKSLGAVKTEEKIKLVLDFAMTEEVRTEHSLEILTSLCFSKEGREIVWAFFKEHLHNFRHRYSGGTLISRVVKLMTEHFTTEEKMVEIAEFFREHHVPGTERVVLVVCEKIRLQDAWLKRDLSHIQDYLASYP